jgi:hypothetical protein
MVQIKNVLPQRKYKFFSVVKARTIAMVSLGLAVVIQFSTEPYMYAAIHQNQSSSSDALGARILRGPMPISNRHGFATKSSLRTKRIRHEAHPLIENAYRKENSVVHSHPRVVAFGEDATYASTVETTSSLLHLGEHVVRKVEPMGQPCCSEDLDPVVLDFEKAFLEDCTPILETPQANPTCNSLHELNLESDISLTSTKGSWRTVWTVDDAQVALKMLRMNRKFNRETYEAHTMDAWVMDRLTASKHVIDAHSFCGNSVITEWASSGGRDQVKSYDLRNRERLKIARDLAQGLADVQALRHLETYDTDHPFASTVFSHNDINIANTVYVDGTIKWNDFNIGVLLRRSKENETQSCRAPIRFRSDLWRSPEEIRNSTYVRLEQTDIYGFGNILYQVMTRHQPWTHKEPGGQMSIDDVAERKRGGLLPTIPEQYKNTTKMEVQALVLATVSCYHPNPDKRPSATELAKGLSLVYDRLKNKKPVKPAMLKDLFIK